MIVLILGANGQVGRDLSLRMQGDDKFEVKSFSRDELDIENHDLVKRYIEDLEPHVIVNAAAYTKVDQAEKDKDKCISINSIAVKNLAQICKQSSVTLIHISTDYVFDGVSKDPYTETDEVNPLNVYGSSKLGGEKWIVESGVDYYIIRTSWVFGEYGNNFVKTMLKLGRVKEELNIVNDQFGGPTYAGDISKLIIEILKKKPECGLYHFAGYPYVSWFEFAEFIFKKSLDKKILQKIPHINGIPSSEFVQLAKRPLNSELSTEKITRALITKPSDWKKELNNLEKYCEGC